jgi:hypothetical protein
MNASYSNEGQVGRDQFPPDCADLLVRDFSSVPQLSSGERSRLASSIEFDSGLEQEFALTLDQLSVRWQYKPRTFAVEWDEDGAFVDSFTPSFFLPARDLYVELVVPDCGLSSERVRKARLLRYQYPAIRIEVLPGLAPYLWELCL